MPIAGITNEKTLPPSRTCLWLRRIFRIAAVFGALCAPSTVAAQDIVVNPSVKLETITKSTLRAIFGMRMRSWPDDTPITVYVLGNDDPLHTAFSKEQLNMFPHQLQRAWDRLVYSGTGQAPIVVSTLKEMAERVAATPGAVGYHRREFIDETLRVLRVK